MTCIAWPNHWKLVATAVHKAAKRREDADKDLGLEQRGLHHGTAVKVGRGKGLAPLRFAYYLVITDAFGRRQWGRANLNARAIPQRSTSTTWDCWGSKKEPPRTFLHQ
jgi:hypothetical protein